ncbi:hypothetical protein OXX79_013960, partial [Metschnikowia pulcherrima]
MSETGKDVAEKVEKLSLETAPAKAEPVEAGDSDETMVETAGEDDKKKKKKKNNKKKKKNVYINNSYPDGVFPEGQWMEYPLEINSYRTTDEEKRYLDRQQNNHWQDFRKGAEIHRRVRAKAQQNIRPGMS